MQCEMNCICIRACLRAAKLRQHYQQPSFWDRRFPERVPARLALVRVDFQVHALHIRRGVALDRHQPRQLCHAVTSRHLYIFL